jgi:DNA-binding MarR family transcriptional regulator
MSKSIDQSILALIHIKSLIHELLEKFGYSDFIILNYLDQNESSDYSTLAIKLKLTPSAISQRIKILLELKLIETCSNSLNKDKRTKHIKLSSQGILLLQDLKTNFMKYEYLFDVSIVDKFKKYLIVSLGAINRIEELNNKG